MKPTDPIWNFYNTLNIKKNPSVRCLDCNAEGSAEVLRLMMSTLVFFSLKYEYQNLAQYIRPSQTPENSNRPLQPVLTSNDQY